MCVIYPSLNLFLIEFQVTLAPCNSQDNPSVDTGRTVDQVIHQNCSKVDVVSSDTSHSHDDEEPEGDQNDLVALDMLEAYSQVAEISQVLSYNI